METTTAMSIIQMMKTVSIMVTVMIEEMRRILAITVIMIIRMAIVLMMIFIQWKIIETKRDGALSQVWGQQVPWVQEDQEVHRVPEDYKGNKAEKAYKAFEVRKV